MLLKMNSQEIVRFCIEKGLLLDEEVLGLFKESEDVESVKIILDKIRSQIQTWI